jgi:hypothetical protein
VNQRGNLAECYRPIKSKFKIAALFISFCDFCYTKSLQINGMPSGSPSKKRLALNNTGQTSMQKFDIELFPANRILKNPNNGPGCLEC